MDIIALIPTIEPDEKLIKLVEELNKNNYIVIVVNGGSDSSYNPIFSQIKNATVLSYKINQGKGYALKFGLKYIKKNYEDYIVVTIDSDGQHKVKDANKLVEYISNNPKDLVIGKRLRSSKTPLRSRVGNVLTKIVYFLATGIKIYDTQTGLRCFSSNLVDLMLKIPGNRFEYEMNVLLWCPFNKIKIKEIEIETIYINNNSNSHFNTITDSIKIYKQIFNFSLISILSIFVDYILFVFFTFLTKTLIANILSKVISLFFKYLFNYNKMLNNNIIKYVIYSIFILFIDIALLQLFISLNINIYIAKLITELILILLNIFIKIIKSS